MAGLTQRARYRSFLACKQIACDCQAVPSSYGLSYVRLAKKTAHSFDQDGHAVLCYTRGGFLACLQ